MERCLTPWQNLRVRRLLLLAVLILCGCKQPAQLSITDRLKPCTGDGTPVDAVCGTLKVFENRATKQGRQIDLNIVVLPALRADAAPDPLFFLAGGPGQGAATMAETVRELFRQVLTERDIVLVDQRGTGQSNPLNCADEDDSLATFNRSEAESLAMLKRCMAGYDADLRLYTTPIAMDDLAEDLVHLGDGFADGEAAERQPFESPPAGLERRELGGVFESKRDVRPSLHDAEHRLGLRAGLVRARARIEAPFAPCRRDFAGLAEHGQRGAAGSAHVELHLDVRANQALNTDRFLGREAAATSVEMRPELEAVVVALAHFCQRKRLKSARIGQHRVRPTTPRMQASLGRDRFGAGSQPEMVGVPKDHARAGGRDFFWAQSLDAPLRTHRHERG